MNIPYTRKKRRITMCNSPHEAHNICMDVYIILYIQHYSNNNKYYVCFMIGMHQQADTIHGIFKMFTAFLLLLLLLLLRRHIKIELYVIRCEKKSPSKCVFQRHRESNRSNTKLWCIFIMTIAQDKYCCQYWTYYGIKS